MPAIEIRSSLAESVSCRRWGRRSTPATGGTEVRFVRGQAGAGKSMLLAAVVAQAELSHPTLTAFALSAVPTTGAGDPFAVFRRFLETVIDGSSSGLSWVTDVGARRLQNLGEAPHAAVQALEVLKNPMMSARPGVVEDQLVRALYVLADRQPILLTVDDLQWADASSVAMIRRLLESEVRGLATIAACRSHETAGIPPSLARLIVDIQGRSRDGIVFDLDGLSADERRSFVDSLIDREPNRVGDHFRIMLTERSEGNALFGDELLAEFVEAGTLEKDPDGQWLLVEEPDWDRWPLRLQAVVAARLQWLDPELVQLLAAASVIGEQFTVSTLASVAATPEADVIGLLLGDESRSSGIVFPVARSLGVLPDEASSHFRFAHNLFQRYLYDRLAESERAAFHRRTGDALATAGSGSGMGGSDLAVEIAHHFELGRDPRRAIDYLSAAARECTRLSANHLAEEHIDRAMGLLIDVSDEAERRTARIELLVQQGAAQAMVWGFSAPVVSATYGQADALLRNGPAVERMPVLFGLWVGSASRAEFDRSAPLLDELAVLADSIDDDLHHCAALHARWTDAIFRGDLGEGTDAASEGLRRYNVDHHHQSLRYGNHDPAVCALSLGALAWTLRGETERAARWVAEAVTLADAIGHDTSIGQSLALTAWHHQLLGDVEPALGAAQRTLALGSQQTAPIWLGVARSIEAWAGPRLFPGPAGAEPAADALRRELATQIEIQNFAWTPMYAALLVESLLDDGMVEEVDSRFDHPSIGNERSFYYPETLRLQGERSAAIGSLDTRATLEKAIAAASASGALLFELKSAVSLTEADHRHRSVLASIVGRLPSTHRSSHLTRAQTLLDS